MQISASDMAYALSSLLEYPHHVEGMDAPDDKMSRADGKENTN